MARFQARGCKSAGETRVTFRFMNAAKACSPYLCSELPKIDVVTQHRGHLGEEQRRRSHDPTAGQPALPEHGGLRDRCARMQHLDHQAGIRAHVLRDHERLSAARSSSAMRSSLTRSTSAAGSRTSPPRTDALAELPQRLQRGELRRLHRLRVLPGHLVEIRLTDEQLVADLPRGELAVPDPAPHRLGGPVAAPRRFLTVIKPSVSRAIAHLLGVVNYNAALPVWPAGSRPPRPLFRVSLSVLQG